MIRTPISRRLAFTASLLLSTAISSAAFAQSITLFDGASFTNTDHIDNIESEGDVGTFKNTASGSIGPTPGNAVEINGNVTSFINAGTITAEDAAVTITGNSGTVENSGTLSGTTSSGFRTTGQVTSFTNTANGLIESTDQFAAYFEEHVADFTNAGRILAGETGVFFADTAGNFSNAASGVIVGNTSAVFIAGSVDTFTNAGVLRGGGGGAAVLIGDMATSFTNSGTIDSADWGVALSAVDSFLNSGTISGGAGIGVSVGLALNDGPTRKFVNTGSINGATFGVQFTGEVGSFSNSGQITSNGTGVSFERGGLSFHNAGLISGDVDGVSFYDDLTSFVNTAAGTIKGAAFSGVYVQNDVTTFANAGQISGGNNGVFIAGSVNSFSNAAGGNLVGQAQAGVQIGGSVEDITNAGHINGELGGLVVGGPVKSFTNTASGIIESATLTGNSTTAAIFNSDVASFHNGGRIVGDTGVGINGDVKKFSNAAGGYIEGKEFGGLAITGALESFSNAGTIKGGAIGAFVVGPATTFLNARGGTIEGDILGAVFLNGVGNFTNAGVLRGGDVALYSSGITDDYLTLLSGSRIFGDLSFGGGHDTLDFSGFTGNTILNVYGLETLVPGNRHFVDTRLDDPFFGGSSGQIAIFDLSGLDNKAVGRDLGDLTASVRSAIATQLGQDFARQQAPIAPLGYVATKPTTGAAAALAGFEPAPRADIQVWTSALAGGSSDKDAQDLNSRYGGLLVGSHTQLNDNLTLGGLVGYFGSTTSVLGGEEQLDSQTGVIGLYGKTGIGVIDLDFSVLAGVSSHTSKREVVANGTTDTASGAFTSVFIAPSLGASLPVLSRDGTTVALRGEVSYVAGLTSGYTETGSAMNLTVGGQSIGFLDVRLGVEVRQDVGHNAALVAKAGVLGQANLGSSTVTVSTLGHTVDAGSPGTSSFGVYGGVGFDAALSHNVTLKVSLDGVVRADGRNSLSANIGIGGTF